MKKTNHNKKILSSKKVENKKKNIFQILFSPRSILLGFGGFLLLFLAIKNNNGYNWTWNGLLKGNMETINKYPNATFDQRYEMKAGFSYTYYNFIKNNTPDSAIILFPESEKIFESKGGGGFTEKSTITYFLYPRQVILKTETDNSLYGRETHVAIASGHGYENLNYEVYQKTDFTVLPKNLTINDSIRN